MTLLEFYNVCAMHGLRVKFMVTTNTIVANRQEYRLVAGRELRVEDVDVKIMGLFNIADQKVWFDPDLPLDVCPALKAA